MELDLKKYPNCARGIQYAQDVLDGKIITGVHVKNAVNRFFKDLERSKLAHNSFRMEYERAEKFMRLTQRFEHVKGVWKSKYILFENWQCFIYLNIYGFIDNITNSRRFRTAHIELARGNGKSANASQVGLYHLSLENPVGNEVYSAATGRDQARIVLDSARAMARKCTSFLKKTGTRVLANKIVHDKSDSYFKALSADSNTLDGLQPACAVIDELHAHKNRSVYDVIDSAMSKRPDSLLYVITTAGFDTANIGHEQSAYAKKVAAGAVEDDTFFGIVFTLDDGDDPFDPKVWPKANPNWGVSVDPINFAAKAKKAKESPDSLNNFLVKHCNIWTNAMTPFFNVGKWKLCTDSNLSIDDFKGEKCWIGVDLASHIDLTAIAYIFRRIEKRENEDGELEDTKVYYLFFDCFMPEESILKSTNASIGKWVEKGWLIKTPGEATNLEKIRKHLLNKIKAFKVQGIMVDPWNAKEFSQQLTKKRMNVLEFRMNTGNFSEPMKRLDALTRENQTKHIGSELIEWCIGNVVAKVDANDNVFPRKEHEKLKIDPIIAVIMGLAGWIQDEEKESVYNNRGIRGF